MTEDFNVKFEEYSVVPHERGKGKKHDNQDIIFKNLDSLVSEGKLFIRWANTVPDISNNSFEIFNNILIDDLSEIAFGLYKKGLLPDDVESGEEYDWENYAEELLLKANNNDLDAQIDILKAFLERNEDLYYDVKERIIDRKKYVGLEAGGVNVTHGGGSGGGVPVGIQYIAYLKGNIQGDNLQNDGHVLQIDKIIAIYDNKNNKFIHLEDSIINDFVEDSNNNISLIEN